MCTAGHRFDIARQGYVSLLRGGRAYRSDTAAMVAARENIQSAQVYAPIRQALLAALERTLPAEHVESILDLGAGTGYYTAGALEAAPQALGVGIDLSKYAARRAAKAHPRLASVVADVWAPLPLADHGFDVVLCVFAPRNIPEIHRVLRPGGVLLLVTPLANHLAELMTAVGGVSVERDKQQRLRQSLADGFCAADEKRVCQVLSLSHAQARDLVMMGPSAFHTDADAVSQALAPLPDPLPITLAITVQAFTRREAESDSPG